MLEHQQLYNTKQWKLNRTRQLSKEPRCVMCLAMNRQTPATVADHVIPHTGDANLFWDVDNLQSLCDRCHNQKTWYETIKSPYLPKTIRPKSKDITLLFGAPCSGRHAWADKQEATVISIDRIKDTVGHDHVHIPTCIAVRNQLIEKCKDSVIIIEQLPNPKHRTDWISKLKAKPLMMITGEHECIRRLKQSNRPNINGQIAIIKQWFATFKPLGNENFIS